MYALWQLATYASSCIPVNLMWIPVQIQHPPMLRIEHPPPQPVGRGSRSARCENRSDLLQVDFLRVGLIQPLVDLWLPPRNHSVRKTCRRTRGKYAEYARNVKHGTMSPNSVVVRAETRRADSAHLVPHGQPRNSVTSFRASLSVRIPHTFRASSGTFSQKINSLFKRVRIVFQLIQYRVCTLWCYKMPVHLISTLVRSSSLCYIWL